MVGKTLISFILLYLCNDVISSSFENTLSTIEKELSVKIINNEKVVDTWSLVKYENCNDTIEALNYLNVLHQEYSKYPKDYFLLIGIKQIVLCKTLKLGDQYRSAIPDPYSNSLFLSVDGHNGYNNLEYLIHVMHHELNHCTEFALWGNMNYNWRKWKRANRIFFRYKGSGAMAYTDQTIDWYAMTHPKNGFLNLYSMTAQEEDRSELIALIMSDIERKYIYQYYGNDKILRKKINLIIATLNDFCKTDKNYWQHSIDSLVNKK